MNNLYYPIPLPFSIDIDRSKFTSQQTRCSIDVLQDDVHRWINETIDALVLWVEIFYLPPYKSYDIHCDGHELDNKCKLNYIINGEDSTMHWFEALDKNKIINMYSKSNTKYLKLEKKNSKEIGKAVLTNLNLVNVGNFHTVYNGKYDRYCISIVIADKNNKQRLNFDEVKYRLNIL